MAYPMETLRTVFDHPYPFDHPPPKGIIRMIGHVDQKPGMIENPLFKGQKTTSSTTDIHGTHYDKMILDDPYGRV